MLRPIAQCMSANEITEISGILNGTTNFILNKMIVDNMAFDEALKLAQDLGYAEKNPAADIEGHDACRKICILAALAFGKHIYPEQVKTEGIVDVTLKDVEAADSFGYVIKLIANTKKLENGKITASVAPTLVSRDCILSGVNGVFNAVMVTGDMTGEVVFYGKGAGKEATASAVVADILDCAKHLNSRKYLSWEDGNENTVEQDFDRFGKFFVRLASDNFMALENQFEAVFKDKTEGYTKNAFENEIVFITNPVYKSALDDMISGFDSHKVLQILS